MAITAKNEEFVSIGENLKKIRGQMNLSLSEAAKLTGVSKTMLSQIERAESIPTISTIWKIANGMKIKFDTLLSNNSYLCDIRNCKNISPIRDKSQLAEIYCMVPFSPMSGINYEFFYCVFHPGCKYESDGHKNSVNELIFVFQGTLDLLLGNECYHVEEGSVISIDANRPHTYVNKTDTPIKLICLVSYG